MWQAVIDQATNDISAAKIVNLGKAATAAVKAQTAPSEGVKIISNEIYRKKFPIKRFRLKKKNQLHKL